MFNVIIITIFPEMFPGPLAYSLAGKALQKGIWQYKIINLRDFGLTKHKKVDDTAYGGGNGLIMRPDVLGNAIEHAVSLCPNAAIYYPSPRGKLLNQHKVRVLSKQENIIIICGRFEGIDERIIVEYNIEELSVGNYILSGGEVACITILDSVVRLLPGVLVNQDTLLSESLEQGGEFAGMLECPLYTKPTKWKEHEVPKVLLSGNHQAINKWRIEQSFVITKKNRPDLL